MSTESLKRLECFQGGNCQKNSNYTTQILNALEPDARFSIVKEEHSIIKQDYTLLLSKESKFHYLELHLIAELVGWKKLWDHALDHGPQAIRGVRNLLRILICPDHTRSRCLLFEVTNLDVPLPEHILNQPMSSRGTWENFTDSLLTLDHSFFTHVICFSNVF